MSRLRLSIHKELDGRDWREGGASEERRAARDGGAATGCSGAGPGWGRRSVPLEAESLPGERRAARLVFSDPPLGASALPPPGASRRSSDPPSPCLLNANAAMATAKFMHPAVITVPGRPTAATRKKPLTSAPKAAPKLLAK